MHAGSGGCSPGIAVPFRPRSPLCQTFAEERANTVTHALGLLVAVVSLVLMAWVSGGEPLRLASALVFGLTLVVLYASSTLYHLATTPRAKAVLQVLDHASIFLLIAGSYTPLALLSLGGVVGWALAGAVWGVALVGVLAKAWCARSGRVRYGGVFSTVLYLAMGWIVVVVFDRVLLAVPATGIWLLVAGGLCYSAGIGFYAWERLPYNHAIWHVFVLGGSVCHVLATLLYILPQA